MENLCCFKSGFDSLPPSEILSSINIKHTVTEPVMPAETGCATKYWEAVEKANINAVLQYISVGIFWKPLHLPFFPPGVSSLSHYTLVKILGDVSLQMKKDYW